VLVLVLVLLPPLPLLPAGEAAAVLLAELLMSVLSTVCATARQCGATVAPAAAYRTS
jgi:hypothetical protein